MRRRIALLATLALAACGGGNKPPAASAQAAPDAPTEKLAEDPAPAGPPIMLDCGDFTTCAIAEGGSVRCWGRDRNGELGDGTGSDRVKSVIVRGVESATSIALASQFACALGTDKKIRCWGSGHNIANDGAAKEHAKPTVVAGVDDAIELVASGAIACARSASAITCWGADTATIGTPPSGAFMQVAAGFTHGCALDKKGAAVCWGTGEWSPAKGGFAKPPITGATFIATGDRHACVITKDKKVQCWGQNDAGQLGTKPDTDPHKSPVFVPGVSGVVRLVAGEAAMCAILADGTARCWGTNAEGELGLGKKSPDERPSKVSALTDINGMCLATAHGCALTKSKSLLCWGSNTAGQLGDGTREKRLEPTRVAW